MEQSDKSSRSRFLILWFLCLVGSCSLFPYIHYLGILPSSESALKLFLISTVQAAFLYGLICYLSFKILCKTDLHPFVVKDILRQIFLPGVIFGTLVGLIIFSLDKTVFQNSLLSGVHPPLWAGALASIYGGINEEVLLRLFLFTFVYFICSKFWGITAKNRLCILWIITVIVAIIFGLGHLPAALKLTTASPFEIFRILLLNGIPGIVFGWLYWSKGVWTAMLAHFVTDLMIHVFLI